MLLEKNTEMFKDQTERIREDVEDTLETYSFEDILEENDLSIEDAIVILVENGFIALPGVKIVK